MHQTLTGRENSKLNFEAIIYTFSMHQTLTGRENSVVHGSAYKFAKKNKK
jgi:hypothetical protein